MGTVNEIEIIQHNKIEGLTAFLNTVDYRTPHYHSEWELLWVLDQPLTASCEGETLQVEKGDILLIPPKMTHEMHKVDAGSTFLCIQVSTDFLQLEENLVWKDKVINGVLSEEDIRVVRKYMADILWSYLSKEPYQYLQCRGLVCMLFSMLFTKLPVRRVSAEEQQMVDKQTKRLSALFKFVEENYMHKIRLSDFAKEEGFSMSYLSQFIKKNMNQSFQEYVRAVRMNCARRLMQDGEKNLTEICMESGFSDYRYFSEAFKNQFGTTPEQYRQMEVKPENAHIRYSLHSSEQIYTEEESREILKRYYT